MFDTPFVPPHLDRHVQLSSPTATLPYPDPHIVQNPLLTPPLSLVCFPPSSLYVSLSLSLLFSFHHRPYIFFLNSNARQRILVVYHGFISAQEDKKKYGFRIFFFFFSAVSRKKESVGGGKWRFDVVGWYKGVWMG